MVLRHLLGQRRHWWLPLWQLSKTLLTIRQLTYRLKSSVRICCKHDRINQNCLWLVQHRHVSMPTKHLPFPIPSRNDTIYYLPRLTSKRPRLSERAAQGFQWLVGLKIWHSHLVVHAGLVIIGIRITTRTRTYLLLHTGLNYIRKGASGGVSEYRWHLLPRSFVEIIWFSWFY